jgi:hypothetical protein
MMMAEVEAILGRTITAAERRPVTPWGTTAGDGYAPLPVTVGGSTLRKRRMAVLSS